MDYYELIIIFICCRRFDAAVGCVQEREQHLHRQQAELVALRLLEVSPLNLQTGPSIILWSRRFDIRWCDHCIVFAGAVGRSWRSGACRCPPDHLRRLPEARVLRSSSPKQAGSGASCGSLTKRMRRSVTASPSKPARRCDPL
jgi:hypothetical protein